MNSPQGDRSRDQILAVVRQRRGLHKSELSRIVGKGWGNVGHHLRILEEQGEIDTEVHGRLLWIFSKEADRQERDYLVATRTTAARRILEALGLRERATIRALSDELAVSKKVIRQHLSTLQRAQAVEKVEGHPPTFAPVHKKR